MRVAGLTGGIASGKSSATRLFRKQGVSVVDCDEAARVVVAQGTIGYKRVVAIFGQEVLQSNGEQTGQSFHNLVSAVQRSGPSTVGIHSGGVDRAKLGALVFGDAAKRRQLNAALHPLIMLRVATQLLVLWLQHHTLAVLDMPLLFETKSHRYLSTAILVSCPEQQQAERLMARDGCTASEAAQKLAAQMSLKAKTRLANRVLDNSGTLEGLASQIDDTTAWLKAGSSWHLLISPTGLLLLGVMLWTSVCWHW